MAVRRRAVRAEKIKRRAGAAALFVLLAAAVLAVVLYVNRDPVLPEVEPKGDESVTFAQYGTDEIVSIAVKNSEGEYTLLQKDGAWQMQGREDFVFSESMLSPLLDAAALVYAEHKVMDLMGSGYQLRDFGLGEKAIRVTVHYTDGRQITFRIGDLMPQETPMYYLAVEGDNAVYAVAQDIQEIFMLHADALHEVTDPALKGELVDQIAFTGENAFTIAREDNEWYLTAPFRYPLSSVKVNALLGKLEKIRFAQYVISEEKADLAAYGLTSPRRTMTLSIAPSVLTGYDENNQVIATEQLDGYDLTFYCGDDQGDVLFYCLYRGDVVLATRFSASVMLTQTYDTLLHSAPFALSVSEVTRFEWTQGDQTRAWDITLHERVLENNEFETDDSGNILYDVRVWQDGQEVDGDRFLLFYSRLIDVETINHLPEDYTLPQEAEITISLHRGERVRSVKLYAYGELHYAVSVDGEAVYYISREAVDGLSLP